MTFARTQYDPATGLVIAAWRSASEADLAANIPEGAATVEGYGRPGRAYVKAGEIRDLPPRPGDGWEWDPDGERWHLPDAARAALLEAARKAAEAEAVTLIEATAQAITGSVPLVERLSWGTKEAAARGLLAGAASPEDRAMISAEAATTGEEPARLAARIVANADAYRGAVAAMTGLRRVATTAIAAAADEPAMRAALDDLRAQLQKMTGG